jgi:hypothetical protein
MTKRQELIDANNARYSRRVSHAKKSLTVRKGMAILLDESIRYVG